MLDPAPPRHSSAERIDLIERGDVAATIHAPVRIASLQHVLDGDPAGVERAGEWVFSREWLDELRDSLERRLATADPLDPGIPPPPEPWAAAVVPLLGLERRGAKLYRPGAAAALGERAGAAAELARRARRASSR